MQLITQMAQAQQQVDIVDDDASFLTILQSFRLSQRARNRFTEDFPTIRDLMSVSQEQVQQVINSQNKTFRHHATAGQRAYITQIHTARISTLRRFAIIPIKEGGAFFTTNDVNDFNLQWINSIQEEYSQKDPEPTTPGSLSVTVPKFKGNNWYEVKQQFVLAFKTVYSQSGMPLSYLIRDTRKTWEDTATYTSLQERHIDTKVHTCADFNKDNFELYRILSQEPD